MKRIVTATGLAAAAALVTTLAYAQAVQVDAGIPSYGRTGGVSGNLSSVGSDTLNNLMTLWAEGFQKQYPNVRIQIEGKGSSTAPPALISGTAQLGPMSRTMRPTEIDEFEKKYGYEPTQIRVAVDALAVYVNKDNPLAQLTLPEVDAIFSKGRACGAKKTLNSWGDAGVQDGRFAGRPISLYGRNSASGTYGYFKEHALCRGDYRDTVKEQPGSASVVQGVTEDLHGIGYSGIGYRTSGVKPLALAAKAGAPYYQASAEDALSGQYPLARFLYVYVNRAPNKPLDPLVREFLVYALSKQGQENVVKDGYLPIANRIVQEELAKIR
jgi:phosphate transport system substrate-binding protein